MMTKEEHTADSLTSVHTSASPVWKQELCWANSCIFRVWF